jgi:hypothetical protein
MKTVSLALSSCLFALLACTANARAQSSSEASATANAEPTTEPGAPRTEQQAIGNTLWVTGLSVFAATYALTGIATTTLVMVADARTVTIGESWIPLVGPWIMLGDSRGFDTSQLALTAVSAVLQTLGCAALIVGLVLENDGPGDASAARVWITPTFGDRGAGLSVAGVF